MMIASIRNNALRRAVLTIWLPFWFAIGMVAVAWRAAYELFTEIGFSYLWLWRNGPNRDVQRVTHRYARRNDAGAEDADSSC